MLVHIKYYKMKMKRHPDQSQLTHLFPMMHPFYLSLPPGNIRNPYGFQIFSEGTERVHCEQMSW